MHLRHVLGAALVGALVLAACGSDDGSTASAGSSDPAPSTTTVAPDAGTFPVTLAAANGDVTIEQRPARVVSLAPVATEMLFAVGAGDQVVAVDDQSNYPPDAPTTDLSGFTPNLEAIASYDPDLVVVSNDLGDVVDGLGRLGIPVLLQPAAAAMDDTYQELEQLGAATGHVGDAAEVVAGIRSDLEEIEGSVAQRATPLTYYYELDDTLYTVTSSTFVGRLLGRLGLENVADPADGDSNGYPQLSAEFLIDADPDVVFLADTLCCGQSAETIAARPGWQTLTAVRAGRVIELDDDVASRWGPRVVDLLRTVADAVRAVPVPTP